MEGLKDQNNFCSQADMYQENTEFVFWNEAVKDDRTPSLFKADEARGVLHQLSRRG